ncbi:MAG: transposase [Deltaproteobacteria bacterium]|nr:transposase [Deltaproteobacteria bacterium]
MIAALLSMRASSQQAMLDEFFASLLGQPGLVRAVSDRAFAQARQRLHMPALSWLNEQLLDGAERTQMVPRWCGFRLVAADASVLMPAVRPCHRTVSARAEALATLNVPSARDAEDWGCARVAPAVRLVRHVAPGGAIRVLATNLGAEEVPAAAFGDLYHQRWRIEEAFKRLKHRLHLEAVSGLSQQALIIDVAAKVLADNIAALLCAAALAEHAPDDATRRCNRSYAPRLVQRALPGILLMVGDVLAAIAGALSQLAANTHRFRQGRSRPRPPNHVKPHARHAYKG